MKRDFVLTVFVISNLLLVAQNKENVLTQSSKSNTTIHLELDGNKYERLSIEAKNYKLKNNKFNGKSLDGRNWFFEIPDSVYDKTMGFGFRDFITYDAEAIQILDLGITQRNDTFMMSNGLINFDKKKNINIKLEYLKRDSADLYARDSTGKVKPTKFILDHYIIIEPDTENILSAREHVNFCWFNNDKSPGKTYSDFLADYIRLIKQHPDSKTLMSMLLEQFEGGRFKSKEDLKLLYNSFSGQNKNSYIGRKLSDKLSLVSTSSKFENLKLQNSLSHKIEPIIADSTKFNLIIFSASWCSPCHKLIPLLKEINNDLNQNLNFVYISLDEQSSVEQWENLLLKENISWRSLLAFNKLEYIKNKFLAYSIPKSWLVYPDGKMEIIDIRNSNDKEKLYKLVKAK